jgi:MFS family permease
LDVVELQEYNLGSNMRKQHLIFYGWLIVFAGILVQALGYGARYSFSVIFLSLLGEFGWTRDVVAAMLSVNLITYGSIAPVAGTLIDTIGPRKTMSLGALLLTSGLALSALGSQPWHFYLTFGVLAGSGLCLVGSVPLTMVLRNWFEKKRGLALSVMSLGTGFAFAFYPVIAAMTASIGWRNTFYTEAVVIAAVVFPAIIFVIRYRPSDKGLFRDGVAFNDQQNNNHNPSQLIEIKDKAWAGIDWTMAKAIRTRRFWMLCITTFCVWGMGQHIMVAHHIAFAVDVGFSAVQASAILSVYGIANLLGCLIGAVSDRIGREKTMTFAMAVALSGIIILTMVRDASQPWLLYYYAAAFGLGQGMATPTIIASVTDVFQGMRVGTVVGFIWLSFAVGGAIGPWLAGWIFETSGGYLPAFIVAMLFLIAGCAAMWMAAPGKVRGRVSRSPAVIE